MFWGSFLRRERRAKGSFMLHVSRCRARCGRLPQATWIRFYRPDDLFVCLETMDTQGNYIMVMIWPRLFCSIAWKRPPVKFSKVPARSPIRSDKISVSQNTSKTPENVRKRRKNVQIVKTAKNAKNFENVFATLHATLWCRSRRGHRRNSTTSSAAWGGPGGREPPRLNLVLFPRLSTLCNFS